MRPPQRSPAVVPGTLGSSAATSGLADAGYGESAAFRMELDARGWHYVIAVKGSASVRPAGTIPETLAYGRLGRPSVPRYRTAPVSLRQLAIAHADQARKVTRRQGTKTTQGNPDAAMTSHFIAIRVRSASRHIPRAADGGLPECWLTRVRGR